MRPLRGNAGHGQRAGVSNDTIKRSCITVDQALLVEAGHSGLDGMSAAVVGSKATTMHRQSRTLKILFFLFFLLPEYLYLSL